MDFSASAATKDAARLRRRRFCTPPRFFSTLPQCVQTRQTCSVGVSLTRVRVRSPVARVASVEETKRMEPTDKAIFGMVSESPGRNASEPSGGLDKL